jgi:copper transport protein
MSAPCEVRRHIGLRFVSAVLLLAALLGPGATPAFGHALLLTADPADGSVLTRTPERIRLTFTQAVAADLSKVELVDSAGRVVPLRIVADPGDLAAIILEPPALPDDAYRVSWNVVSNDDLHPSTGTLVFGVGVAASTPVQAASSGPTIATALEVGARGMELLGLSVLVGAVVLLHLGLPSLAWSDVSESIRTTARARRRLARLAIVGGAVALAAGSIRLTMLATQVGAAGAEPIRVLQTGFGVDLIVVLVLIALLAALTAWTTRVAIRRPSTVETAASLALVGLISLAEAATTHFASLIAFPIGLLVGAVHLLTAAVWVGGLVAIVVALLPMTRANASGRAIAFRIVRRFGVIAAVSVGALVVTGLYATGQLVASLDALVLSTYGQILMVKIGLVLIVAVVGLRNALTTHPGPRGVVGRHLPASVARRLSARRPARSIAVEMVFGVAVVAVVALLGVTPPARGPEYDPIPAAARTTSTSGQADDLLVLVNVRPNRPGRNFVTIGIHDTRRPAPAPIDEVRVTLVRPDGVAGAQLVARSIGDGRFELAGDSIGTAGQWSISLTIARSGLPPARMTTPWTVVPAGVSVTQRRTVVSDQPLAPILTAAALLGTLLLAAVLAYAGYRRARVPAIPEPARGPSPVGTLEGWPG